MRTRSLGYGTEILGAYGWGRACVPVPPAIAIGSLEGPVARSWLLPLFAVWDGPMVSRHAPPGLLLLLVLGCVFVQLTQLASTYFGLSQVSILASEDY